MSGFAIGTGRRRSTAPVAVLAVLSVSLLAGCAKRDSITVGSVPDDYRTNHPIVVAEQEQVIDLPVGASQMALSRGQKDVLGGFMGGYERETRSAVRILVPSGSANGAAAAHISSDVATYLRGIGVHGGSILVDYYDAGDPRVSAPIRVSYSAMRASAGKCGRWPDDILKTSDNKHYANFGCSAQNNLAAQVANPADLLGPRRSTSIDPENRADAIDQYKNRGVATDFSANREVNY